MRGILPVQRVLQMTELPQICYTIIMPKWAFLPIRQNAINRRQQKGTDLAMRYHIDTIPVWDALKLAGECPLCALRSNVEMQDVERFLGGSVMEPDTRVRVNASGFCQRHHQLLYAQQNRLGHALMTHTHLKESAQRADKILQEAAQGAKAGADAPLMKRAVRRDGGSEALLAAADALDKLTGSCIMCQSIDENMRRYAYTFVHLYANDAAFKHAFEQSKGVCLKDAALLLRMAAEHLHAREQADFAQALQRLTNESLGRVADELEWFTLKFDYRNADKPWNNSRDALERAVTKLRGGELGSEAGAKKR